MQFLDNHPDVCYINLALDSDKQGREATEQITAALTERFGAALGDSVRVYDHPPTVGKDYNEELVFRQERFREQRRQAKPNPPAQNFDQSQQPPWQQAR